MKKSLLALAVMAASGLAFAQTSVTSTVNGGTSSYSQVNGVNQGSFHGAGAYSTNTSQAGGAGVGYVPFSGGYSASATSGATTTGSTVSGAYGIGAGSSSAGADQFGSATNTTTANAHKPGAVFGLLPGAQVGSVSVTSGAQVGTQNSVTVNNTGIGASGTNANSWNTTTANVNAPAPGTSNASGGTVGNSVATTWGGAFGGTTSAGGTLENTGGVTNIGAANNGQYSGTITRP